MEITTKIGCRNNCYFCPQKKIIREYAKRGPEYLSYHDFCTILNRIPKYVGLHFSGFSEPFLNPETSKMMETAYKNGYNLQLFTTLVSLKPSDVEKIKNIKFDKFLIHIPDSKYFRYDTDKWLDNLALIFNAGFHPQFMTMGEIDNKIERIVGNCNPSRMISRAGTVDQINVKRRRGKLICQRLKDKCSVLIPNGDVYLCCMDYGLKHRLGSLLTGNYDQLFKGDEYKRVLKAVNSEDGEVICRYCEKAKIKK